MKILPVNMFKYTLGAILTAGAITASPVVNMASAMPKQIQQDTFEHSASEVPPEGTTDNLTLRNAPNPKIRIQGKIKTATIVVDLSTNILYHYDNKGQADIAYSVASGKKSTPTSTGIRKVTHIETYPYKGAPRRSKRRRSPRDYGPKIICLEILDPKTGETSTTGEFIHGNNNAESIGKYVSHGCIRMDNEVIKDLSSKVQRGDIVIIK